jgi:hypothetical protein
LAANSEKGVAYWRWEAGSFPVIDQVSGLLIFAESQGWSSKDEGGGTGKSCGERAGMRADGRTNQKKRLLTGVAIKATIVAVMATSETNPLWQHLKQTRYGNI